MAVTQSLPAIMMKPTRHIVAYIDILGFQESINRYFSGIDTDYLEKLENAYNNASQ